MNSTTGQKPPVGLMENAKRADFELAWMEREQEAGLLRAGGSRSMEICLRFYALECRIKAIICKHLDLDSLPKACKTHDLTELLIFSGLHRKLLETTNEGLEKSWDRLAKFSKEGLNDVRYLPDNLMTDETYNILTRAFDDPSTGVHSWLSEHP